MRSVKEVRFRTLLVHRRRAVRRAVVFPFWWRWEVIVKKANQEGQDYDVPPATVNSPHTGELGPGMLSSGMTDVSVRADMYG
jgi:hypothetical protein